MNIQGLFPLGLTGLISLLSKGLSRVLSSTTVPKASVLLCSAFSMVQLSHPDMTTEETIVFIELDLCGRSDVSVFNTLSRFFHSFSYEKQASFNFMETNKKSNPIRNRMVALNTDASLMYTLIQRQTFSLLDTTLSSFHLPWEISAPLYLTPHPKHLSFPTFFLP